jgi:hypothetical protein
LLQAKSRSPPRIAACERTLERLAKPEAALFLFFSNRMGCGSSLLITALGSLILLWLMGWLRF